MFFVFFIVNYACAQVVNDDCANAILITPSSTCSPINGTLLNATTSSVGNSCVGNRDVFYKFTAIATTGTVKVTSPLGLDAVVSVMNACNSASSLYCIDIYGSGSTETVNMTNLVIGVTYYIKVQAFNIYPPSAYTFTICVLSTAPVVPVNDNYINAIDLLPSSTCSTYSGTLLNATTSSLPTLCSGNNDVFYKFTAISSSATINVTGVSGLDVTLSLFTVSGNPVPLYCVNNAGAGGVETINASGLYSGTTYYIQVQSYNSLPTVSTFNICVISRPPTVPPANDECVNAINLTTSTTCAPVSGTLQNATTSAMSAFCLGNSDVFYKFTATATNATVRVVGSSGLDLVVGVYSSCGVNYKSCQDVTYSGGTEIVYLTGLTIGSVYYIQIQAYASTLPSTYTFTVCVQSAYAIIPSNDNCTNATILVPSPSCTSVSGTLLNASNSSILNSCAGGTDVFYLFEATASTATVEVVPSVGMDIVIGVFESCNGVNISCTDAQSVGVAENVSLSDLVIGNTYLVQVKNITATTSANAGFTICLNSASPPPPINDECTDAITIYPTTAYAPITGNVKNATISTATRSCAGNSDVFYKFIPGARTATITVVGSAGFDPVVGLFRACGTSHLDCVDYSYTAGGTEVLTSTNLTIGSTYYIKVQDYSNTLPTTFSFTVAVQSTPFTTDTDASTFVQQINLFPNPTQDVLNVENIQMETTIELVDLRGKVLFTRSITSDTKIDLSEFAAGVYVLKLSVDGVVENRRVVVSR